MSDLNSSTFPTMEDRKNGFNGSCLVLQYGDNSTSDYRSDLSSVKQVEFWMAVMTSGIVITVVTFVGIPGNVVNSLVFYRLGLKERINLCLFALAVVNLTHLVVLLVVDAEYLYTEIIKPLWVLTPYVTYLSGTVWASQFLSAVIASERCLCVVSPFHAKRLLKTSTMAAIIVVCSVLLAGGMGAIAGPKHSLVCVFHPDTKVIEQTEYVTEYYIKNKQIIDVFDVFVYAIALPAIFLFIIIIATVITAVRLRAAFAWRLTAVPKTTTATGTICARGTADGRLLRTDVSVTLMLMRASVLIALCMTANFIMQICRLTLPGFNYEGSYTTLLPAVWRIVHFFWTLNSSMNFFVYYNTASKFREFVRNMLCTD